MRNIVVTFGIICLCSLILLQMAKVTIIKDTLPIEAVIGASAGIFLIAGILIARRQPRAASPQPETPTSVAGSNGIDYVKIDALGISKREYEILCEIAHGLSNTEIAAKIFLSESTVKTHISNLLMKLNAKRRTEAVRIARELKIIN